VQYLFVFFGAELPVRRVTVWTTRRQISLHCATSYISLALSANQWAVGLSRILCLRWVTYLYRLANRRSSALSESLLSSCFQPGCRYSNSLHCSLSSALSPSAIFRRHIDSFDFFKFNRAYFTHAYFGSFTTGELFCDLVVSHTHYYYYYSYTVQHNRMRINHALLRMKTHEILRVDDIFLMICQRSSFR